jgi:hypothetical protein
MFPFNQVNQFLDYVFMFYLYIKKSSCRSALVIIAPWLIGQAKAEGSSRLAAGDVMHDFFWGVTFLL